MTTYELISNILKIVDALNFEWNIHFVFNIALIGWLVSIKRDLSISVKLMATVVIILFSLFSIFTINEYYKILEIAVSELRSITTKDIFRSTGVNDYINGIKINYYRYSIWLIHIPIDCILLISLWWKAFGNVK